jgi:DNA-binding LytR/AlgR family response regulator
MEKPVFRIAVCDDEKVHRDHLMRAVRGAWEDSEKQCEILGFSTGKELLEAAEQSCFDLIFLDILMDGMDGMQAAQKLRADGLRTRIVFVTSSPDFVFRGYEVEALRYLMKPFREEQIREVLRACRKDAAQPKELLVRAGAAIHKIPFRDIYYVEAQRKSSAVVLKDRTLLSAHGISDMEKELPEDLFFRCQKSFIVNLRQVASICRYEATLKNGAAVPVSRAKWAEMKERLIGYLAR